MKKVKRSRLLRIIPKKIILIIIGGLTACFVAPSFSSADIYKYVDPNGVVHFTNAPTHGKFKLTLREEEPVQFRLGPTFEKYDLAIWKSAEKYKVDYALIKAVIKAESNFDPKAISRVGAKGLMQLMPKTAYAFQVRDSFHPENNIEGGVRYLRYLLNLFDGNLYSVLAAYNAGEKAVFQYNGVPPYRETRTFVQRVLHYFQQYNREPRPDFSAQITN
ncbi:MAG: lytic transglycosylase domain-containing protein [Deltaproteobacteria bacterium]|nr:lytic transglycosylase domain-containing protein [Deltaproteobacteria bacterium]